MPRRAWAILALSFGTALLVMDNTIATVALPILARELNVSPSAAVAVVSLYQMVLLMALLPLSSLGDVIGNRRLYQAGQLLFVTATLLCFLVNSLPSLLMTRVAQALGVAAVLSVNVGLLRRIYPTRRLGQGLALNSVIIASASAMAPTVGGLLLTFGSWRWVFVAAAPFALVSLLLGRSLPEPPPSKSRFDLVGALLCAATFGALIGALGLAAQGEAGWPAAGLAAVGLPIGWMFIRRELRSDHPTLPVDLLNQARFALPVLAALLAFAGTMTFNLSLPFRLQTAYGLGPAQIGGLMASSPLAMFCAAPLAGILADRTSRGALSGLGMAISTTAFLCIAVLPEDYPGYLRLALPLVMGGAGLGLFLTPNNHMIMSAAPSHRSATAGAMISTTRLVGSAIGATCLSLLLSMGLGRGAAPALLAAACTTLAAGAGLALIFSARKESLHA
ncbi:MAG: MFS transporter [Bordetella sp.]|nr:MFS transporter [Bordetella sp.]